MTLRVLKPIVPLIIFIINGFFIHAQDKPSIIWENEKAIGLTFNGADTNPILKVAGRSEIVSGKYQKDQDGIVFYPLWPLSNQVQYEIWKEGDYLYSFNIPISKSASTPRLSIYPIQDRLPDNLLKFYFVFSEPMLVGKAYENIYLLDEQGEVLPDVFLHLSPELWNQNNTMLTLWLDPGRIKRDLALNKMKGSPLNEGSNYELIVSENWKSSIGVALGEKMKKSFYVESSDRKSSNTGDWSINKPKSKNRDKLVIEFGEPLDFVLLGECISIWFNNQPVKGEIEVAQSALAWSFRPLRNWSSGEYKIVVEARLEDLAGNNLNRLFDEDLKERKPEDHIQSEIVEFSFELDF